jgi:NADH-quinone oxidoreductase subunit C
VTIPWYQALAQRLQERFAGQFSSCKVARAEVTLELPRAKVRSMCLALRDEPEFGFEQLMDLGGVDYLEYGQDTYQGGVQRLSPTCETGTGQRPRFAVVYHLLSLKHNQRLRLRTFAEGEPPVVDSVVDIWNSANWYEREAFDLFGILFEGHPDLRRLLTDYGFVGHPFRKDFPLIGNVEVRYDIEKQRVVYQPVTIEPRILVPKVIRDDTRYIGQREQAEGGLKR